MSLLVTALVEPLTTNLTGDNNIEGLQLWLDAQETSTLSVSSGNVSKWVDRVTTAKFAFQNTVAEQPNYLPTGLNGRPTILFNGTTEWLTYPPDFLVNSDWSMTIVEERGATGSRFLVSGINGADYVLIGYQGEFMIMQIRNPSGPGVITGLGYNIGLTLGIPRIHTITFSTTLGTSMYLNGILQNSDISDNTALTTATTNSSGIGGPLTSQYFNGKISSVIMHNRAINGSAVTQLSDYLKTKWGIA